VKEDAGEKRRPSAKEKEKREAKGEARSEGSGCLRARREKNKKRLFNQKTKKDTQCQGKGFSEIVTGRTEKRGE